MKCTSKSIRLLSVVCLAALFLCGCENQIAVTNYPTYDAVLSNNNEVESNLSYFATDLCVADATNFGLDKTDAWVAQGAGVFNLSRNEVTYNQNIHARLYPASTTKVLTAYIICQYADLNATTTVSQFAATQEADSSVAYLATGDVVTVRDLLYGLMLCSGNDAAIALAEYYSGSVEAFAEVMNAEAKKLGATNTHFVNPHGLPDDNHYTSVYDMYLMFRAAISNETFLSIISSKSYDAVYVNRNGETVKKTYNNTNRYLTGSVKTPEGFHVIGGKTGTTYEAGYCLVLLSENQNSDQIISIVYKADCKHNLYLLMNELLTGFGS